MTLRNLLVENINYGFLKLMIEKIRVVTCYHTPCGVYGVIER